MKSYISASTLKVRLTPLTKICIIWLIESPLKMMKNAFYFILKALSILKIFKFLSRHLGHVWKTAWLNRLRLISKFMTSQPGFQTIPILILLNISQSKGSQTMKFGQLTEYNKRNIFLQVLCRKWGKETSSRPLYFLEKLNMTLKQVVCSFVSICFDSAQLAIQ